MVPDATGVETGIGTYAVKKIEVGLDDLSVKPLMPTLVAMTLQLPEMPSPKFALSSPLVKEHADGWLGAKT
jgi:hypothetical protein